MRLTHIVLLVLSVATVAVGFIQEAARRGPGAIKMHLFQQFHREMEPHTFESSVHQQPLVQSSEFPARYFQQPLDHFSATNHTFLQRYWVSTRHYRKGGPVFVLDGGETTGEDRLPFLDTGILDILAKATGGLSIVLEHRYYGTSMPVANFTTDALRWLNNAQSAADSANFMSNFKFSGINESLASPNRPWIYYGGSYAGARAAHMRILYPSLVFGSIASSAVTHAAIYNWEYTDLIRNYTAPPCRRALEQSIIAIDQLLSHNFTRSWIKNLFGLGELEQDEDFASVLQSPIGYWQAMNWDPAVGSTKFDEFCDALVGQKLHEWETIEQVPFPLAIFNYARYIRKNIVSKCPEYNTVEQCFGTTDPTFFQDTSLSSTWRAWTFQVCTEWGYFHTAPPDPKHPTIISRLLTLEYASRICKMAFPPGKHFTVPLWPNVTAVNALGDFDIADDRLAFIDGEIDPWRPATPHSDYATTRNDTLLRPFKLIPGGVHHWDENGLRDSTREPAEIKKIHKEEVEFVLAWLRDWEPTVN